MQNWSHRHLSTTHNPRRLPAPSLRPAQRPLMASRLIPRRSPGSFSLFTEFLCRRPSRRLLNCSPCTARRKKLSSTTHGPVTSHACFSSNRPQPQLWRHWSSGPITRPGSTAQHMPKGDAPTLGAMAASWALEPGYLTKLTEKSLSHLIVTARLLSG